MAHQGPPLQPEDSYVDPGADIDRFNGSTGSVAAVPPPPDGSESPRPGGASSERDVPLYPVKRIPYFQRIVPILCQNENGPCPLLAICKWE